jgi:heme/copper-type cytochrome/quinol oxidase subunit 2
MIHYSDKKEIILIILISFLAIVATDPFSILMPSLFQMMLALLLLLIFITFSIFLWREKSNDEREELHRLKSGKVAFWAGSAILIIGIVYQIFNHSLDNWLVGALVVMVATKAISLYKNRLNS